MMNDALYSSLYNPDVLSCLANLSNDEVFTPPSVVNAMLDMLPQELFHSPATTFLDPSAKSGVFLREVAKRLIDGLAEEIPDLQERLDHIFHKQIFGIAITEITSLLSRRSLYCSKFPNSEFSVSRFDSGAGNVRFTRTQHRWQNGKCVFCGASQSEYDRDVSLETHAYEWIHTTKPEEIFGMKFDVIIGNPPYQLSDGGNAASASPIYQLFVEKAKKLNPRFLTMIIPSRWFAGGKGLDEFRSEMINDTRIIELHDFLNASDCFGTGVEIKGGVCYFLWSRDQNGKCHISTHGHDGILSEMIRYMKYGSSDVFIRRNEGISILDKVIERHEAVFSSLVSSRRPFGFPTNYTGSKERNGNTIELYQRGGVTYIQRGEIDKNTGWIDMYKVYISKAYNAGDEYPHQIINKPFLGRPNTCCTETYIVIGPFTTEVEALNVISYISTKFFRFLVSLRKISQDATQKVYSFVPMQDFSKPWTDEELYAKYGLTDDEIAFIESMIRPMDTEGGDDDA